MAAKFRRICSTKTSIELRVKCTNAVTTGQLLRATGIGLVACILLVACDVAPPTDTAIAPSPTLQNNAVSADSGRELRQRQAEFLNRIRAADPQQRTIDRALLNEQNELGLILDRSVEMNKIPDLMRGMLTQMAREFPGQDLTVLAYAPSQPPRKIGTAHLNAKTRDMSYTPER